MFRGGIRSVGWDIDCQGKLVFDIRECLGIIPAIEGNFSPSVEFKRILELAKESRRAVLKVFKDKLKRRRESWALCRIVIEQRIEMGNITEGQVGWGEDENEVSANELNGIIDQFATHYGFDEENVSTAKSVIKDYIEMRDRIKAVRNRFQDDLDLIEHLTGERFPEADRGDFRVEVGRYSFNIYCNREHAAKLYSDEVTVADFKYLGFSHYSKDKNPINYSVIVECRSKQRTGFTVNESDVVHHEDSHHLWRFLSPYLEPKPGLNFSILRDSDSDSDSESHLEIFLAKYLKYKRDQALNRVKNEIFAMKSERYTLRDNLNIFLKLNGDAYDFLKEVRDQEFEDIGLDELYKKKVQEILIDGYKTIIDRAILAFNQLSTVYTDQATIALLSDKTLREWPKAVRRILAN